MAGPYCMGRAMNTNNTGARAPKSSYQPCQSRELYERANRGSSRRHGSPLPFPFAGSDRRGDLDIGITSRCLVSGAERVREHIVFGPKLAPPIKPFVPTLNAPCAWGSP